MSVLSYACQLEIEPGVTVPLAQCTADHLAAARVLEARKATLHEHVRALLADAARLELSVPEGLREQIALWQGDLRELEALHGQLEEWLLLPV